MTLNEIRKIDMEDVRAMCIRYKLYTCGTNEEYAAMFDMIDYGEDILTIAKDIFDHSDKEYVMAHLEADNEIMALEFICYELINECSRTYVVIEE